MAKPNYKTVGEYLAAQPRAAQAALKAVRSAIRAAVPGVKEEISYQIAAFKLPRAMGGKAVLHIAAWKEHYSLYPATAGVFAKYGRSLGTGEIIKHTMRFPLSKPVPVKLIERIARFRASEVAERAKNKRPRFEPGRGP